MIENSFPGPTYVRFCRTCDHSYGNHSNDGMGMRMVGYYIENNIIENDFCKCKEYITKDNLRYLEYCYEKGKK
jgi:hypothetical protein